MYSFKIVKRFGAKKKQVCMDAHDLSKPPVKNKMRIKL